MSREIVEIVRRAYAALGNAAAEEAVFKLIEADLLDRRPSALCSGRWGGLHLCSPLFLAPNFDKRKAKSTNYLNQDPDANQDVEHGEDLHPGIAQNEIRIRDARSGQGSHRKVEAVDQLPAVAEGVGQCADYDQHASGAEDGREVLLSHGVSQCLREPTPHEESRDHGQVFDPWGDDPAAQSWPRCA
jgi:hypothetical protein